MRTKQELNKLIDEKGAELNKLFSDHKDAEGRYTHTAEQVAELNKRNDELTELGKELDTVLGLEAAETGLKVRQERDKQPVGGITHPTGLVLPDAPRLKTVREIMDESVDYQAFLKDTNRKTAIFEIPEQEFKTLITLATLTPQPERRSGIVPMALEERTVADLMMQGNTSSTVIEYYEQTTLTNSAAEVAEAAEKPESAIAFTLRSDTVRKIATWIPVTDEALRDVPRMQSLIEGMLMFMVKRREELQLLRGNGIAPNLHGVQVRTGVQTYAKAGLDSTPDAIYKGMNLVRNTGFAEPTAVVFHPNDWMDVRLLRTADGIYIWGNPSDAGPERIWGKEIRQTTEQIENTALVGAFRPWAEVVRRDGLTITASSEHAAYFIENKVAVLAEERLALEVTRPSAFCTVTSI